MINQLLELAAWTKEGLGRPSPDIYAVPSMTIIEAFYEDTDLPELKILVELLSKSKVHPATDRPALLQTINTHFQHMINQGVDIRTGRRYQ